MIFEISEGIAVRCVSNQQSRGFRPYQGSSGERKFIPDPRGPRDLK